MHWLCNCKESTCRNGIREIKERIGTENPNDLNKARLLLGTFSVHSPRILSPDHDGSNENVLVVFPHLTLCSKIYQVTALVPRYLVAECEVGGNWPTEAGDSFVHTHFCSHIVSLAPFQTLISHKIQRFIIKWK